MTPLDLHWKADRLEHLSLRKHDADVLRALIEAYEGGRCAERYMVDWFVNSRGAPPEGLADCLTILRRGLEQVTKIEPQFPASRAEPIGPGSSEAE